MSRDGVEMLLAALMSDDDPDRPVTAAEVLAEIRPAWMAEARCRDLPTSLFFPPHGGPRDDSWRQVCAGCPVHEECLAHAMSSPTTHGVWGGTSTKQRARMRSERRPGAA